jgi:hypothetical protein
VKSPDVAQTPFQIPVVKKEWNSINQNLQIEHCKASKNTPDLDFQPVKFKVLK